MSYLDLHLHSCYSSDGEYTPKELIIRCVKNGVRIAAISDHNSTAGIKEGQYWAEKNNITLIPSIELDCRYEGINLHVLGYWIQPDYAPFLEYEKDLQSQEQQAAQKKITLAQENGITVNTLSVLRLAKDGVVTGEMIAEAALSLPENKTNPLLAPYYPGGARSDNPYVNFYWDFCSQGKPLYVPVHLISLSEAIQMIKESGGVPVLAHPGNNLKENIPLLHSIINQGICGIEVYSSYHTTEQTALYLQQASMHHLAISCGSDFHGKIKPMIEIGSVECNGMEEALFNGLLIQKNNIKK